MNIKKIPTIENLIKEVEKDLLKIKREVYELLNDVG